MKHFYITSLILFSLIFGEGITVFALPQKAALQTYEEYKYESTTYCDSNQRTWYGSKALVPKIDYPEFSTEAVNDTIKKWRSDTRVFDKNEKLQLQIELDSARIGDFSGFKTLEVARIGYRTRMNALFACASISSRLDTLTTLQKVIEKKVKTKNSEILNNIKKIADDLKKTSNRLECNIGENSDDQKKQEMIVNLTNSASHQYCYYRHYLNYLDSNTEDVTLTQRIEKGIGVGSGTVVSETTGDWNIASKEYKASLNREIGRANTTLPKARNALIEMDQTYGVHILLTYIYDDYIKLRYLLSKYMNISSQLYQKANNAQSTNIYAH